jgi:YD repeat-containing protein
LTDSTTYDKEGRPLSVTRGGVQIAPSWAEPTADVTTAYGYDAIGRKVWEFTADRDTTRWSYDPAGNVSSIRYPRGHVVNMTYTKRDQLATRIWANAVLYDAVTCFYASPGCTYTFPHFPNEALGRLYMPPDTAAFQYDVMGNMTKAWNLQARISRIYNPNGTLDTDSLRIRNYTDFAPPDPCTHGCPEPEFFDPGTGPGLDWTFNTFVYVTRHGYQAGRRMWT